MALMLESTVWLRITFMHAWRLHAAAIRVTKLFLFCWNFFSTSETVSGLRRKIFETPMATSSAGRLRCAISACTPLLSSPPFQLGHVCGHSDLYLENQYQGSSISATCTQGINTKDALYQIKTTILLYTAR